MNSFAYFIRKYKRTASTRIKRVPFCTRNLFDTLETVDSKVNRLVANFVASRVDINSKKVKK